MGISLKESGTGTRTMHAGLALLASSDVLVGIPEGDNRAGDMLDRAANMALTKKGKTTKKAMDLAKLAAKQDVSNAELMFIHTNGSPLRHIPARPVIEPAIAQAETAAMIAKQLAQAATMAMDGKNKDMEAALRRAGMLGMNASKRWFTDSRNGWAPNSPLTIALKGSDKPLIDTGSLRRAITFVVEIGTAGGHTPGGNAALFNGVMPEPEVLPPASHGEAFNVQYDWDE